MWTCEGNSLLQFIILFVLPQAKWVFCVLLPWHQLSEVVTFRFVTCHCDMRLKRPQNLNFLTIASVELLLSSQILKKGLIETRSSQLKRAHKSFICSFFRWLTVFLSPHFRSTSHRAFTTFTPETHKFPQAHIFRQISWCYRSPYLLSLVVEVCVKKEPKIFHAKTLIVLSKAQGEAKQNLFRSRWTVERFSAS